MIGVEVLAYVGMDAGWSFALVADAEVFSVHGIHVGAGTSEVA